MVVKAEHPGSVGHIQCLLRTQFLLPRWLLRATSYRGIAVFAWVRWDEERKGEGREERWEGRELKGQAGAVHVRIER